MTFLGSIKVNKYYVYMVTLLVALPAGITISHFLGDDVIKYYGNLAYLPVGGLLLIVAFWSVRHFGIDGVHGIGWLAFTGFAMMWILAEIIWMISELIFQIDPFPSTADLFYLMGYPFLLMFLVSYLIPFKEAISKKLVMIALSLSFVSIVISTTFQLNNLYMSETNFEIIKLFDVVFSMAYLIADGIILVPTIIGIGLFLRDSNRTKPLWILIFFGILFTFVGDSYFMILDVNDEYYTGHPGELLFYFAYVLLAFGVYGYGKNHKSYFIQRR